MNCRKTAESNQCGQYLHDTASLELITVWEAGCRAKRRRTGRPLCEVRRGVPDLEAGLCPTMPMFGPVTGLCICASAAMVRTQRGGVEPWTPSQQRIERQCEPERTNLTQPR